MKKYYPSIWNRLLYFKMLGLIIFYILVGGADNTQAQGNVDRFLVPYFASYKEPASSMPGASTAAVTVITISNIFNMQCNITVNWLSAGAVLCETATDAMSPLLPNGSVHHCSRRTNTLSGVPNCSATCPPREGPVEGLVRIKVNTECINHIGVQATIYSTLFESDMDTELILGARTAEVYKLDSSSIPPSVQ